MATIDLSRVGTDLRKRYAGVRMQQGRVLTDDDFNDAERIDAEDTRRTRVDVIGPVGSPDGGFLPVPAAGPLPLGGKVQFSLAAGTLYLAGLRLEQPASEAFELQKDWLNFNTADPLRWPNLPAAGSRVDLVWIEAWQQPVSAVEDSEKFEAALGSADTAVNIRTMRRIAVLPDVNTDECPVAWAQALALWAPVGTLAPDMELVTQARLRVTYTAPANPGDLCSPPVAGGYLGAENQAIRVQLVDATHYTWGYDNAAPLYRVQMSQFLRNGVLITQLKLLTEPKDAAHWPLKDQVAELLPWSAALPNGETLAELNGHLARVTVTYNPDDQTLEIDNGPPAGFGTQWQTRADKNDFFDGTPLDDYFFLRMWNRGDDVLSPPAIPIANGALGNTGLSVSFTPGPLRPCDFWIIAARPATPDQVVPWRLEDVNGAPPHGVKRYRAPLGLIRWTVTGATVTGELIHDCRRPFLPLTKLRGCCTVTVGDGTSSFGMYTSIQAAVNALPPSGGTVCVLPGTYDGSVLIANRANIVIHGCDARSRVRAGDFLGAPMPAFLIVDSHDVAIERLGLEAGPRSAVEILRGQRVAVRQCVIQMRDLETLYQAIFARGDDLVIERNLIDNLPLPVSNVQGGVLNHAFDGTVPPPPAVIAHATRGGIQLGGGSERVRVLDNVIRGGIWNGITLGSILIDGGNGDDEPDVPGTQDPCKPLDTTHPGNDAGGPQVHSAGALYDIEIRGNVIEDMGANGIAVLRFFPLHQSPIMVSVHGLHIHDNRIVRCLRRFILPPPQALQWLVGYGGIVLAWATDLRVTGNIIEDNGVEHLEPVCGLFALAVKQFQFDCNRVRNNGPRSAKPAQDAKPGVRGGVWVWMALAESDPYVVGDEHLQRFNGVPAMAMRDNLIVAPVGRPLTMPFAMGHVVVARNRMLSQGTTGSDLELMATTVLLGNLGLSNEWTLGLLYAFVLRLIGKLGGHYDICALAIALGLIDPQTLDPWTPLSAHWPTGKTLITDNQIGCELIEQPLGVAFSSVLAFGLDDIAFTDNQCEIESRRRFFFTDVFAFAGTVRIADNRLSETWMHAWLSAWGIGLMATVTDNQTTHCVDATALLPGMKVLRDNRAFVTAFCPTFCSDRGGGSD